MEIIKTAIGPELVLVVGGILGFCLAHILYATGVWHDND